MSDFKERIAKLSPQKLALLAVSLQSKLDQVEHTASEPIAIVGMGCRIPGGANDPESLWQLLRDGVDAVAEIPSDRWDVGGSYSPDPEAAGKMYTRQGAFLKDIDRFDPHFFGIAPREAVTLDPQQRLLLEVTWEALEHAAQPIDALMGSQTGVFVGVSHSGYLQLQLQRNDLAALETYVGTGGSLSVVAGRLSYVLGLQGPSVSIDTACSSSLVALHLACQSLIDRECRMAIAGGVNLILGPEHNVVLSRARMLSPDGRCKAFDASADGFGRGEGCGVVVLKRLSEARADGDRILALIRGSAVNQDGRSSGLTAPNGVAQEALLRRALSKARVEPAEIGYLEAHGTGTELGDPIEIQALGNVLGQGRPADRPVLVGSIKTNVGHLEAAAGIAGLLKVVLALQHETIPPHLHFRKPNPLIPWAELPVSITADATPWPKGPGRRLAGISSFGFSGTNAHLVIEEAPIEGAARRDFERPLHVMTISARSEDALRHIAARYAGELQSAGDVADASFTVNVGRALFPHRAALVASSGDELKAKLTAVSEGRPDDGVQRGTVAAAVPAPVAFLFTGQGSQYVGMGRALYETQPVFRRALEQCHDILKPHLSHPLLDVLYPPADRLGEAEELIHQTAFAQPALFAIEYALAELWRSWGIEPAAVFGHSVGEYAAASVAGAIGLEDGLRLIAERGRLMQALPAGGSMAVLWASETDVRSAMAKASSTVSIAAINGPRQVTIAGPEAGVAAVCKLLESSGVRTRGLRVSHAFHSSLMEPMLDAFADVAAGVRFTTPRAGIVSSVTGRQTSLAEIGETAYWRRQVREPVRFQTAIENLYAQGFRVFVEIGPTATLSGLGEACLPAGTAAWLPSLRQDRPAWKTLLDSLSALYVRGIRIDWRGFDREYSRRKIALATYPFERQRYWLDKAAPKPAAIPGSDTRHPFLGRRIAAPLKEVVFEQRLGLGSAPFLADHAVYGSPVFPATASLEMAIAAASEALGGDSFSLEQLSIAEPLVLDAETDQTVASVVTPEGSGGAFQMFSRDADGDGPARWRLNATCTIAQEASLDLTGEPLDAIKRRCSTPLPAEEFYRTLQDQGMEYGPAFRGLSELRRGRNEALALVKLPDHLDDGAGFHLHPALLDACFQAVGAAVNDGEVEVDSDTVYLAVNVDRIRVSKRAGRTVWSHVRLQSSNDAQRETLVGDLRIYDENGDLIADVERLRLKRANRQSLRRIIGSPVDHWLYEVAWPVSPRQAPAAEAPPATGTWLLVGDKDGIADDLGARLTDRGARVAFPSDDLSAVFAAAEAEGTPVDHVVYLGALETLSLGSPSAESLSTDLRLACGGLLEVVQEVVRATTRSRPRLSIVTRGAQAVTPGPVSVAQAALWGFARTISLEHPDLRCTCIDLDGAEGRDGLNALVDDLWAPDGETEVAYRGAERHVARLQPSAAKPHRPEENTPVDLVITKRGVIDNLEVCPMTRRAPGSREVEVEVEATGLNFRDVLNVLGMYPGDPGRLGNEFAGTVVRVGGDVEGINVGQQVIGIADGCFGSYVTTAVDLVAPKPARLTVEDAATVPVTFLTAHCALHEIAGMRAGDRVLIHAAAGGVGVAAVQLALRAGAEIFATAGSDDKRSYLQSLGVTHIMSSRTLDFAREIKARTNGEGIDIVLNSLAGDFIPASLGLLRSGGRFVEIGKTGIWTAEEVSARYPGISYSALYLGGEPPARIQAMMRAVLPAFENGSLKPLPRKTFAFADAKDAFRFMAQAKHIGKIVIGRDRPRRRQAPVISADATYLLTGGLGALGLHVARTLVTGGARHLVLTGRRAPSPSAQSAIGELQAAGARVEVVAADISVRSDVAALLERIKTSMPPLRGVIHAAGVRDDGVITEQRWSRFEAVMAPKVAGTWHLHELTADLPLDFFVLFSSMASVFGSAGQSAYAAANAFMDALAHERSARGLPTVSINWGPWAESGMAASLSAQDQRRITRSGVTPMTAADGSAAFERVLAAGTPQISVLPAEWSTVARSFQSGEVPRLLAKVTAATSAGRSDRKPAPALSAELKGVPAAKRRHVVQQHLRQQVGQVLGLEAGFVIGNDQGLRELGMDSLMAVELRNRLQSTVGRPLPSTLAFDCPTIDALTSYLMSDVLALADAPAPKRAIDVSRDFDEPVAIVGMGCRFPGEADSPDKYWSMLREGVDAISEVPPERWDVNEFFDADPDAPGKMYVRHGGFLGNVDRFDAGFFGISPREAASLDPQQRLLLEVSWEALEHAGLSPDRLMGSQSGVFVGISTSDYAQLFTKMNDPAKLDAYVGTGNSPSVAAGRLSYVLGLQGPCLSVDTACSSALVAVHLACNSLRQGECRTALAGGVNLMLIPDVTINFCRARMLSPDGRCKTFDQSADGYVRGEGAGVVVLKRLSDAQADGDRVLAIIRGSAVNQDGRSSGLTVPNGPAQEALIEEALRSAGVAPRDVSYIEAHGTGTSLGDPIEMHALKAVFGDRPSTDPLMVGSVKTNFGHLEAAAGIAALIKVVLAMQHGEIPPHLHFEALNPHIALDGFAMTVPTVRASWNAASGRRVAGVSSFGFSGTNAHLVLEEAPAQNAASPPTERPVHVVTLSARTESALKSLAARLSDHLVSSNAALGDIAFTLNTGRSHLAYRLATAADSLDSLRERLAAFVRGERRDDVEVGERLGTDAQDVAFEFKGAEGAAFAELLCSWGIEPSSVSGDAEALRAFSASTESAIPIQQPAADAITIVISPDQAGWEQIGRTLSHLYVKGVKIDWQRVDADYSRNRVALPTYPFERERYWLDTAATEPAPLVSHFERAVVFGGQQSEQGPFDLALDKHADRLERLDRLTTAYIVAAFREFGAFATAGERRSVDLLIEEHRILPTYKKLLIRWLGRLASENLLRQEGETFVSDRPLPEPDLRNRLEDVSRFLKPVLIQYLERCGTGLVKVLRGTVSALDTLFPSGSFELSEELYTKGPTARYTNGIVRAVVESVASGSRDGVRILEVGAGTGGTTTVVLPALPPDRSTYCFTDMSQLFLSRAQSNFKAYPFVQYGILNIEKDPVAQGYPARAFDVVVAANVIHATADLRTSLENTRSVLAPGGVLVLSETTVHHGWFDMTTALIEGWDRHDDELRGDNPMMSTEQWRAALTATGFESVAAFPEAGSPAEVLGLHVIVAGVPSDTACARGEIKSIGFSQPVEAASDEKAARQAEEFLAELAGLLPDEQHEMLVSYVRDVVSAVLRLDPSRPPDRRHRLMDLGVDSLMAVEFRNRLGVGLGITKTLPATLMFDYPTIEAIAKYLAREVLTIEKARPERLVEAKDIEQPVASQEEVAQMSDEEVEALLLQRLESL